MIKNKVALDSFLHGVFWGIVFACVVIRAMAYYFEKKEKI